MTTINQEAIIRDIVMDQGKTMEIPFTVTKDSLVLDLTGYILRAQFRKSYDATDVIINCTNANSKLVFTNAAQGAFKLALASTDTSYAGNPKVTFSKDSPDELDLVYDLEVESPTGIVYKVCKGTCTIKREVTRT